MRINKTISWGEKFWSANKISQPILQGSVWRSVWRICIRILGLKRLKECFCTCLGSKQLGRWLQVRPLALGYAVLMIPNEDETAVHGCHCQGDIDVCMWKVLAIQKSWYMRYSAEISIAGNSPALHPLPTHLPFAPSPLNCPSPSCHPPVFHPLPAHLPFTPLPPTCLHPLPAQLLFTPYLPTCPSPPTHLPFAHSPLNCPSLPCHPPALHPLPAQLPFTLFLPNCSSLPCHPPALCPLATQLPFTPSHPSCPSLSLHPCTLHTLLKMQIVKTHTLF